MRFRNERIVEASKNAVFERLTDFSHWERAMMQSGGMMRTKKPVPEGLIGAEWELEFKFRGKRREAELHLVDVKSPEFMEIFFKGKLINATLKANIEATHGARTRMTTDIELKPLNFQGRLLIQAGRLARKKLLKAIDARLARFANEVEYMS